MKQTLKPSVVAYTSYPGNWEAKAGGLWALVQPQLHGDFEASLGYLARPCLKSQNKQTKTPKFSAFKELTISWRNNSHRTRSDYRT
jgi:hypothetical protein